MQISFKDDINSLSYFKANFAKIVKKMSQRKRPMVITQNGKSAGIFIDIDTWEGYVKKINLIKLVHEGEVSLKNEKIFTLDEVKANFKNKFGL